MTIKSFEHTIEYSCRRKPTPEERKEIRDRLDDPYTLTGFDKLRVLYEWQGLEFDEKIFDDVLGESNG